MKLLTSAKEYVHHVQASSFPGKFSREAHVGMSLAYHCLLVKGTVLLQEEKS